MSEIKREIAKSVLSWAQHGSSYRYETIWGAKKFYLEKGCSSVKVEEIDTTGTKVIGKAETKRGFVKVVHKYLYG
ncbi:hypothetical protein KZP23_01635 [Echinicola marina]|uniref:hypothetical protein n=1 Tax=Echinicola marina TaxID=2859768 RepID=UPI001CF6F3B1|nr:hypothetical protein [Echinicola marina]UCS93765.1 hypothetical protein KZP23_01635 [Echinicola marina]